MKCFVYMGWLKNSSWMGEKLQVMAVAFTLEPKGRSLQIQSMLHIFLFGKLSLQLWVGNYMLKVARGGAGGVSFASGAKWSCPLWGRADKLFSSSDRWSQACGWTPASPQQLLMINLNIFIVSWDFNLWFIFSLQVEESEAFILCPALQFG